VADPPAPPFGLGPPRRPFFNKHRSAGSHVDLPQIDLDHSSGYRRARGCSGYLVGPDFWENGYTCFFELAKNIAAGNGVSLDGEHLTAFRVPLYPMFLAAVTFGHQAFIPVLVAQSLIGAGTVLCAALIAKELFGNAAAIISAALTAIYPYYVMHDTALQETSLHTFLTALAVLLLLYVRRSGSVFTAAAAGLSLGTAVLTRANLAPFALIAPLWLGLAGGSQALPWRGRIRVAIVCASVEC
jgi:hypothetical protein